MNIFAALSQGKGRLNEENMSAMLGFLLNPSQTHDIGDVFLHRFLTVISQKLNEAHRFEPFYNAFSYDLDFEKPYVVSTIRRFIDIEVRLYQKQTDRRTEVREIHRIAIENKIKTQSANPAQFKDEYDGVLEDIGDDPINVTMVFITPPGNRAKLAEEFDALHPAGSHRKVWLHWHDDNPEEPTITRLIRDILADESMAKINPLSDYLRHTLKAFVYHIEATVEPTSQRPPEELGQIINQKTVTLSNGITYQIERYDNSTIKVLNLAEGIYEPALSILKTIIQDQGLAVSLHNNQSNAKNTRQIGKDVIDALL